MRLEQMASSVIDNLSIGGIVNPMYMYLMLEFIYIVFHLTDDSQTN